MKRLLALAVLAMLFMLVAACTKPVRAEVSCQEHTQGFQCNITSTGAPGKTVNVCWDINVTCADNQKLSANTCQDVEGQGKASAVVPNTKFTGGTCKVGKVTGISVTNVKITTK